MNLIGEIALKIPSLGRYKRFLKALYDSVMPVKSYSQHGEDLFIKDYLSKYNSEDGIYIDVGANHPTSISNTYLLYRNGFTGILIEPNPELAKLQKLFRVRDKVFDIGIDNKHGLFEMNISKTPVLSSFNQIDKRLFWKKKSVPVLKLDDVFSFINPTKVLFLSIDTEGLNYNVIMRI